MPVSIRQMFVSAASQLADGIIALAKLNALTTKGDLLGYSTTHARLPVGTDGQVLTAAAAQAAGVQWATPSAGKLTYVGGQTLGANATVMAATGLNLNADLFYLVMVQSSDVAKIGNTMNLFAGSGAGPTYDEVDANYVRQYREANGAVQTSNRASNSQIFNGIDYVGHAFLYKNFDGKPRMDISGSYAALASVAMFDNCWGWNDTTNLTALEIKTNGANNIAAGSYLHVWKVSV